MTSSDRREFQRLKLTRPIVATMGGSPALVLDIGMSGAFLEHYGTAEPGTRMELAFRWQGEPVEFSCEVARSQVERDKGGDGRSVVSHSGVHFLEAHGESAQRLREMMAASVARVLAAQRANAEGHGERSAGQSILARLGEARRIRTHGFVTWRLRDGRWWRTAGRSAEQPRDGFTVAGWEDEEEVAALCSTYEVADEEGRRLIRLIAEISATSVEEERGRPRR